MSETRGVFKTGVSAVIYSNTNRLIKGNTVRDKFLVMADSVLFIDSDKNVAGGYLGIHLTNSNVDVSFIKSTSPSGKYLQDNGTWASIAALPGQAGNSGKFLTTDGTAASWAMVSTVPSQTGSGGKFLTTDGTTASWASVSASPAGSDTYIQYNKSGGFDGTSRFVWDYTNRFLKVDGSSLFGLATSNSPTAFVDIAAATASRASLRI